MSDEPQAALPLVSLKEHPRARNAIQRSKGYGALIGFVAVGGTMYRSGATLDQAGMRALAGGVGGWMLAWIASVVIWRQLLVAEARAAVRQAVELRQRDAQR